MVIATSVQTSWGKFGSKKMEKEERDIEEELKEAEKLNVEADVVLERARRVGLI